ncbi:MAG: hypothetical protein U5K54_01180 [Cytophagales bacterium]|nr:hypothetical protein [Cytophagales bacterium]
MKPFVEEPALRSQTVIVAETSDHTERIIKHLQKHQFHPGDGYGSKNKNQLRFANFPTHSKETFERLVDLLEEVV